MGLGLPLTKEDNTEIEAVRRRWALLKGAVITVDPEGFQNP